MTPTVETEIAVLKEQLKQVIENTDSIKNNHLPHIYDRLGKLETRLSYYAGGIVVASAVINYLLK
jgi:hypothetical protein